MSQSPPDAAAHVRPDGYVFGIDLLRLFSALMVCNLHFTGNGIFNPFVGFVSKTFFNRPVPASVHHYTDYLGYLGVQTFFAISGFVIAYSLNRTRTPGDYALGRFLRIYPMLIVCTIITVAIVLPTGFYSVPKLGRMVALDFLLSPVGDHLNGVLWTLPLEIFFYVAAGLLFWRNRRNLDPLVLYLGLGSLIFWAATFINEWQPFLTPSQARVASKVGRIVLLEHGGFFAIGIIVYNMVVNKHRSRLYLPVSLMIAASSVLDIIFITHFFTDDPRNVGASSSYVPGLVLFTLLMAALVLSVAYRHTVSQLGPRLLWFVKTCGRITYPFYLLHFFVGGLAAGVAVGLGFGAYATVIAALVTIVVSYIVALWLDPVAVRLMRALILGVAGAFRPKAVASSDERPAA